MNVGEIDIRQAYNTLCLRIEEHYGAMEAAIAARSKLAANPDNETNRARCYAAEAGERAAAMRLSLASARIDEINLLLRRSEVLRTW